MVTKDTVFILTQSILSILIVLGGGLMMYTNPSANNDAVIAIMSAVIGYFFNQAAMRQGGIMTTNAQVQGSSTPL